MIRTYLSNDYVKRTIRPLFSWTQATPKPCFLDPAWTRAVPDLARTWASSVPAVTW